MVQEIRQEHMKDGEITEKIIRGIIQKYATFAESNQSKNRLSRLTSHRLFSSKNVKTSELVDRQSLALDEHEQDRKDHVTTIESEHLSNEQREEVELVEAPKDDETAPKTSLSR